MGPAAGMGLGPQVPAGAPSSSLSWPRASTVEGEPASARRGRGWRDEAVDASGAEAKTRSYPRAWNSPPARHPAQQRRSASSARPHARRAADICARSGGSGLGHVGRGGCGLMFCPCFLSQTCRSMAEHLPMAGSGLPNSVRELPKVEGRLCFSSSCTSSKH